MLNIGVDLHKTQFTVCIRKDGIEKFSEYPTTDAGYSAFQAHLIRYGEPIRLGVESTGNTRYFKNRMEEIGAEVVTINTLKFKVVNESVKKTDKHDAATIAEFLEKDMLPESRLCSQVSEELRRLLKARTALVQTKVVIKNQIHALLVSLGMEDKKASLQSKRGRQRALDTLQDSPLGAHGLVAQSLFDTIDQLDVSVKSIEKELEKLTAGDAVVELLQTIPGCGKISAWTIRAYTDDIKRFATPQKYASFSGMAPWVQNSNETVRHGRITKRGPVELRTAFVQVVMGMRRAKKQTGNWRLMTRYERLKANKGSGKSIIATARKVSTIVWHMLNKNEAFNVELMVDRNLIKIAESMRMAVK
jgi:transposase